MKRVSSLLAAILISLFYLPPVQSQYIVPVSRPFTRQDTLRGSITPERAWWDLTYYHLDIVVKPSDSTIYGKNTVAYRVVSPGTRMQIDLQEPLSISSVEQNGKPLKFTREGNVYWIDLVEKQEVGKVYSVILSYGGKPKVSVRPPWSGGITWSKDSKGL